MWLPKKAMAALSLARCTILQQERGDWEVASGLCIAVGRYVLVAYMQQ